MGAESRANPFAKDSKVTLEAGVRDAYGRILNEGDKVILDLPQQTVLTIQSITPVLAVNEPPNLMDILLSVKFRTKRQEPMQEVIRIIAAEEIQK